MTRSVSKHRKVASSFRDTQLLDIFQLGCGLLRKASDIIKTIDFNDTDQVRAPADRGRATLPGARTPGQVCAPADRGHHAAQRPPAGPGTHPRRQGYTHPAHWVHTPANRGRYAACSLGTHSTNRERHAASSLGHVLL